MNAKKVIDYIIEWLKSYATNANVNGFVIGVSGGIDSAVASTLCAKTGFPVLCIEMPIHQNEDQVNRAYNHINWLQKSYKNTTMEQVNLTPVFDNLIASFPSITNEEQRLMALANTRARLRMTSLYYFAAIHGYLVVGTGNKVEDFGVGFFTKYGDGGVDISPIADLMKSEVYKIANYLGINSDIILAPPTDGLWGDDKTDEDQIGASYDELEWAMLQDKLGKKTTDFEEREKEVFIIYTQRNSANKHKMIPIPVCKIPTNLKS